MNFNYKFLLTVVISMFFSAFASDAPVVAQSVEGMESPAQVASQDQAKPEVQIVQVDQKLLSQIMTRLAELHIKVESMAIEAVEKNLKNINENIRKQFGPILETLVLIVLPNGEGVVVKKQELEDALGYDLAKFVEANRKAIEERENSPENNEVIKDRGNSPEQNEEKPLREEIPA